MAEEIAARASKSDRVYVEGNLTLNTWQASSTGETKTGLNVAAWRCEKVPAIGKNRQFREKGVEPAASAFQTVAAHQLAEAPFKTAPHSRERPKVVGRDDFNDRLPF